MSEVLSVIQMVFHILSFVVVILLIPLIKFLFELRLKIERIEVILNIILKDLEQLKKEVYDGKDGEN